MVYLTAMESSPVFEFPYIGNQINSTLSSNDDISTVLAVCRILSIN